MADTPSVLLPIREVRRRVDRLLASRSLGATDQNRLVRIVWLLQDRGEVEVRKILDELFRDPSGDKSEDDFRKFRSRLLKSARKARVSLELVADPPGLAPTRRKARFQGEPEEEQFLEEPVRASVAPTKDYDPQLYQPASAGLRALSDGWSPPLHSPGIVREFMDSHGGAAWRSMSEGHRSFVCSLLLKFEAVVQLAPAPATPGLRGFEILGCGPALEPFESAARHSDVSGIPRTLMECALLVQALEAADMCWQVLQKAEKRAPAIFMSANLSPELAESSLFPDALRCHFRDPHCRGFSFELDERFEPDGLKRLADVLSAYPDVPDGHPRVVIDRVERWRPETLTKADRAFRRSVRKVSPRTTGPLLGDRGENGARVIDELTRQASGHPLVLVGIEQPAHCDFLRNRCGPDLSLWGQGWALHVGDMPRPALRLDTALKAYVLQAGAPSAVCAVGPPGPGQEDEYACLKELSEHGGKVWEAGRSSGERSSLAHSYSPANWIAARTEQMDAMQYLMRWVSDPHRPFCAILGDYGTGKTFLARMFTEKLLEMHGSREDVPLPVYLNFKNLTSNRERRVPTLEELLSDILRNQGMTSVPADRLLKLAHDRKVLLIFDGIDEKTVNLTPSEAYQFWHQLRRAVRLPQTDTRRSRPKMSQEDGPGSPLHDPAQEDRPTDPCSKVLLTCRTHYFRNMGDAGTQMTGNREDGLRTSDFQIGHLNPFDSEMIERYVKQVVTPEQAEAVLKLIRTVYNLKDLVTRPYLLALLVEHLRDLKRGGVEQVASAAGLYELVVRSWLDRDYGKHTVVPKAKELMVEELAAYMWSAGSEVLEVDDLENWVGMHVGPLMPGVTFSPADMQLVAADVRAATFLGWKDTGGEFRFLHRSLQEFFLARRAVRGLSKSDPSPLAVPILSEETRQFVLDLLQSAVPRLRGDVSRCICGVLEGEYREHSSENALLLMRSWNRRFPADRVLPEALHLAGSTHLAGLRLEGMTLQVADFRNAVMPGSDLVDVAAQAADFSGADLSNCRLTGCDFSAGLMRDAALDGVEATDCCFEGMSLSGASLGGCLFFRCNLSGVKMAASYVSNCTFADCGFDGVATGIGSWRHCAFTHHAPAALRSRGALSSSGPVRLTGATPPPQAAGPLCFAGHASWVNSVAFSPDGARLASASSDNTVKLWDPAAGRDQLSVRLLPRGEWAVFDANGSMTGMSAGSERFLGWNVGTARFPMAAFSRDPDGTIRPSKQAGNTPDAP